MKESLQCLPRSAVLRIHSYQRNPRIVSLVNHSPHLIQLEYNRGFNYDTPTVPAWCQSGGRFDSLSLRGYAFGEITCFCKKLALCFAAPLHYRTSFPLPPVWILSCTVVTVKWTCTFSFALALLNRRRLPMLQELIFIVRPLYSRIIYPSNGTQEDLLGSITDLLMESNDVHALMRLISIPILGTMEVFIQGSKDSISR
jgi:hypothetical protein